MTAISNPFLDSLKAEREELLRDLARYHAVVPWDFFYESLILNCENMFLRRGVPHAFVTDEYNKPIIRNMYFYLIGNREKCEWDIDRGILLIGSVGCGKSVLMNSFIQIQGYVTHMIFHTVHAKEIINLIKKKGIDWFKSRNLYIDELGREALVAVDYGMKIKPMIDMFAIRYENGGRTYATSNFTLDTLEGSVKNGKVEREGYGNFIRTRMDEMFNVVVMKGPNRRAKGEMK